MSEVEEMKSRLFCLKQASEYLNLSYRTVLRRIRDKQFPNPIEWSDNIKLWLKTDIDEYKRLNPIRVRRKFSKRGLSDREKIMAMLESRGAL